MTIKSKGRVKMVGKITGPAGLLLGLLLVAGSPTWAKMELPPELRDEVDIQAFAAKLRKLIPEISVGNKKLQLADGSSALDLHIDLEQNLLASLKKDPEFVRLAEARPPLQIFSFQRFTRIETRGIAMAHAWTEFLRDNNYRSDADEDRVIQELNDLFEQWPKLATNGFFSGWASLLTASERNVLREPNPIKRWAAIKNLLKTKSMHQLRDQFQASRFGVGKAAWTWAHLDKVVQAMVANENRILVLVQELNPERSAKGESWLLADNLTDWFDLPSFRGRTAKLLQDLKIQALRLYADPRAVTVQDKVERELIMRELPPYLAIYRGCVGRDCSTTASWAYSYSPMERTWWIEDRQGRHLGYASGTITRLNGEPCLYIKDVTGPYIEPGDVELILDGFYRAAADYGARHLTIMNDAFTAQNHYPSQAKELMTYNRNISEVVKQEFVDQRIREKFLGVQGFSDGTYDSVTKHTMVRHITSAPRGLPEVKAVKLSGQIGQADPNKNPAALWNMLLEAVNLNELVWLESTYTEKVDWESVVASLRNENRLPVERFHQDVEEKFTRFKLPLIFIM